jgi:hypothetical protein
LIPLDAIAFWSAFDRENVGRLVFDAETYTRIVNTVDAVLAHPGARRLLCDGRAEQSLLWHDANNGAPCKARIDFLRNDYGVVDLKTAMDASPDAFGRAIASFEYPAQAAWYWNAMASSDSGLGFFAFTCRLVGRFGASSGSRTTLRENELGSNTPRCTAVPNRIASEGGRENCRSMM